MLKQLASFAAVLGATLLASSGFAQLSAPNATGVAMGHLHYFVDDVAANRDFWVALGGTAIALGVTASPFDDGEVPFDGEGPFGHVEIVSMPGVLILISEPAAGSSASVVDHVAFRVRSLAAIAALGFELEMIEAYPGIASIYLPGGGRVELFEEGTATNIGFDPAAGLETSVALRHNRPLRGPIDSHHLHLYLPEDQVLAARDWYVAQFGAVPGMRWRYDAADLPGMNVNFSATDPARAPTQGQSLDHIGFEIEHLEAFCAALEVRGIAFEQPFRRVSPAFALAVLTDPWGTTIELTEGLAALPGTN